MKMRTGFVGNSSSSSFVVVFPDKPTTDKEVFDMMIPASKKEVEVYDEKMTTSDIASRVMSDISKQKKNIEKPLKKHFVNKLREIVYDFNVRSKRLKYPSDAFLEYYSLVEDDLFELEEIRKGEELRKIEEKKWESFSLAIELNKKLEKLRKFPKKYNKEILDLEKKIDEMISTRHSEEHMVEKSFDQLVLPAIKRFKKANPGFIALFEFTDNIGEGVLEHGDIFRNLENFRISHH